MQGGEDVDARGKTSASKGNIAASTAAKTK